jgi:2,3-bisphosphoglycerate-independent phosphoglycerate mutase
MLPSRITPTLLLILDGFGIAKPSFGNAITATTAPYIFTLMDTYPTMLLKAHGKAVGLLPGQEGNSEAGHFAIGAGRVVEQDLVSISRGIKDGTFFKNTALTQAIAHAKKHSSRVHVMGLLTDGQSAHAHPDHLYAILKMCHIAGVPVALHLFTDGRDSSPHGAITFLRLLRKHMFANQQIATISGRMYGMDRNKLWDRTARAYEAIVRGTAESTARSAEEAIEQAYNRGQTDEFIEPAIIKKKGKPAAPVADDDAVIFFNARSDRARQLTKAFVQIEFNKKNPGSFKRKRVLKNVFFCALTDFGPDLGDVVTAYPSPDIPDSLAAAIGDDYAQLYISESEKFAHITFFINGGYPHAINGEKREVLQSPDVYSYAKHPQMQTKKVVKRIVSYLDAGTYTFVCCNFPNADMVGHTGDIKATKKAVQAVDDGVKTLVKKILLANGQALIVGDHGNAEQLRRNGSKEVLTEHSVNPVPCIVVRGDLKGKKPKRKKGSLVDVAPTLLSMMGIKKPKKMTGKRLM